MQNVCKYCGSILLTGICPVCHRDSVIHPPQLMGATLFNLNPHLKKRLEWRQNIRQATGITDLPLDPTQLNIEDLPPKILPDHGNLPREKKKKKGIEPLEM